jgi:hypothetical protein
MGMSLDLYVNDGSIQSPYLSKAFKDEIIFEWYINFKEFLNEEEIKIVTPNIFGEITLGEKKPLEEKDKSKFFSTIAKAITGKKSLDSINDLFDEFLITSHKVEDRERYPEKLKEVLKKVENQLITQSTVLPLVHTVYETEELIDEIEYLMIEDMKAHIEGNLFYYENYHSLRDKILIKSYYDDFGKIDFYVEVKAEIQIDNKTYFTNTITKAAQFKDQFQLCYDFLDQAIKANKKVLWEFG